jgi:hypothetical protein
LLIGLAQLVLTFDLEVQRCHVVEHDRQARGPGGMPVTGPRDHGPVIPLDHALEAAHERHPMRGRDPDLGQDADGVQLAGRLDHPGQDQRPERPIAETIQAKVVVDAGQDLPQDQRGCAFDHRWRPRAARAGVTQIQSQLPGMAAFPGDLQQHGQLVVGVG